MTRFSIGAILSDIIVTADHVRAKIFNDIKIKTDERRPLNIYSKISFYKFTKL